MPEDSPIPAPKKTRRPPAPGWLWAAFGLVPVVVGALILSGAHLGTRAVFGLILGAPMLGGLALSASFFDEPLKRIVFGIAFGVVILVGLFAIVCAGCMCGREFKI